MAHFTPVLDYIDAYWPRLIRQNPQDQQTLIGLPRPYMVPSDSSDMFQEMYYWDSYFISLGLVGTEYEQLILDMTENMVFLFNRFGVIPSGSRYYFLSRSQPPFLTAMIWLSYEVQRATDQAAAHDLVERWMPVAEREHEIVWLGTQQPHRRQVHAGLSRYYDINSLDILAGCEGGWDHSARCEDRWLDHLPVDLNAILYQREKDLERAALMLGDERKADSWHRRAEKRRTTMLELMWDEREGFFFDYDYVNKRRTLYPTLAGFYPLWAGLATPLQVQRVVRDWLPRFEREGGLVTSLTHVPGRQWGHPNGWAPLHWIAVNGLENYGWTEEARRVRQKWCDNCAAIFEASGGMWEKYNVVEIGGELEEGTYGSIKSFGWSNAIFVDFVKQLGGGWMKGLVR